jgi:SAM-dependent methyltransferase
MTSIDPRLTAHREAWARKPGLRAVYGDYHERILERCRPGITLEIGGGSGHLADSTSGLISLDILPAPWLDLVADAQRLPFAPSSLDNVVMVDVLHHLPSPATFLVEAQRVLKPGGKLVMLEPAITPASWPFLHFLHPEEVRLRVDPLTTRSEEGGPRDPFESNQAIPTLLFGRRRASERFQQQFPALKLRECQYLSMLAYPLSGGFQRWSLLPARWVAPLLRLEERLEGLGRLLAFRLLITIVKAPLDDAPEAPSTNRDPG